MSKIFTILTLLWLLSIGGTTNATDWYYVGPDASGNQLFIDNDSVQKSDYDALLWLRVNELGGDELRYKVSPGLCYKKIQFLETKIVKF